jgi:hypothetical protein
MFAAHLQELRDERTFRKTKNKKEKSNAQNEGVDESLGSFGYLSDGLSIMGETQG